MPHPTPLPQTLYERMAKARGLKKPWAKLSEKEQAPWADVAQYAYQAGKDEPVLTETELDGILFGTQSDPAVSGIMQLLRETRTNAHLAAETTDDPTELQRYSAKADVLGTVIFDIERRQQGGAE